MRILTYKTRSARSNSSRSSPSDSMITPTRNVDLPERSTFSGGKAHRPFKKMPFLSQILRWFRDILTTDALPDPPRTGSYMQNFSTTPDEELTKTESKSMPATPQKEQDNVTLTTPFLPQIPRQFRDMLTTDALPDPPRTGSYMHNFSTTPDEELTKTESKSMPATPQKEQDNVTLTTQRQKSLPNEARPTTSTDFCTKPEDLGDTRSTSESKKYKRPRTKTKPKNSNGTSHTNNLNFFNCNNMTVGTTNNYTLNVNNAAQSETDSKTKDRPMPEYVEELSTCEEQLGLDDMLIINKYVGHGWRDIARRLSYSNAQIEQFEENYRHKGIDEVIYQLLLDWKQANTRNAQLGTLVSILWACQEYDCVERLAAVRKNPS